MRKHISNSFDLAHTLHAELLSQTKCIKCNKELETPRKLVHHRGRNHEQAPKELRLEGALVVYGDWRKRGQRTIEDGDGPGLDQV